ncbi:DUF2946 family protein [Cognatiluteimonas weifangensis]|uniref:DUF2946 family protein n=1 Tax=Cognatiluteimonas weifangensis TaxID=2303539 RepID=UPI00131477AB|nr:DUF2946 family protein [Luteimonas weifangensis]
MIHARAFRRTMHCLALVAALLLALLPTMGRMAELRPQADGVWAQICTLAGLQQVQLPALDPEPSPPSGDRGMDCAYCPLLSALAPLLLWALLLLWPQPAATPIPALRAPPRGGRGHPSGLGSRGPPIAL